MRSHVFSLCPDSHFAHEQFRNCIAQSKNSYFARQSENSHFAQDNSGIVPILTLCRTYIRSKMSTIFNGISTIWRHKIQLFPWKYDGSCEFK